MEEVVLLAARFLNGVIAGVYAAFLLAFMPALHSQPDAVFSAVMNRINVVIVNPVFLLFFLGAPVVAGLHLHWDHSLLGWIAAGTAVAAVVITFAANIPLNNALAAGGARSAFATPWLVWHAVRTAAAVAAFALLCRGR